MKTPKTQVKQQGFFAIGIALGLLALFGATTAAVVTLDKKETAAIQQMDGSQQQVATPGATTIMERPTTEIIESVTADIR